MGGEDGREWEGRMEESGRGGWKGVGGEDGRKKEERIGGSGRGGSNLSASGIQCFNLAEESG